MSNKKLTRANYKKLVLFGAKESGKSYFLSMLNPTFFEKKKSEEEEDENMVGFHFSVESGQQNLFLNTIEYRLSDEEYDQDETDLIESILYHCQSALLFIDSNNYNSLENILDLLKVIHRESYLNLNLVYSEKSEIDENGDIKEYEVKLEDAQKFAKENSIQNLFTLKGKEGIELIKQAIYNQIYQKRTEEEMSIIELEGIKPKDAAPTQLLRLLLLGNQAVGKSAFLMQFSSHTFTTVYVSTAGVYNEEKVIEVNGKQIQLSLWDTAGQEKYKALPRNYYSNADGILLLFDVHLQKSFEDIENWIGDIRDYLGLDKIVIYLLGNKIDINKEREITKAQAIKKAETFGIKYLEISCKLNLNLTEAIFENIEDCIKKGLGSALNKKRKTEKKKDCCK